MSKEKKKSIIFTIILALIAVVLIILFIFENLTSKGTIETSEVKEIMNNFYEYYNSDEKKVIYYASSSCSYCSLETPILETIADDYDIDYYYVDSSLLPEKQRKEILEKLGIDHATPTTVVVENGEALNKQVGYVAGKEYVEFFISAGIVPEDAVYSGEQYITFIDYSEYEDIINSDDTSIVVIGQTSCSHCIAIKPALNKVAGKYNLTINYLNMTDLTEDERNSFVESLTTIEYNDEDFVESGSFGTPLTLILRNKKVSNYISGERTVSQLVREFKKANLID